MMLPQVTVGMFVHSGEVCSVLHEGMQLMVWSHLTRAPSITCRCCSLYDFWKQQIGSTPNDFTNIKGSWTQKFCHTKSEYILVFSCDLKNTCQKNVLTPAQCRTTCCQSKTSSKWICFRKNMLSVFTNKCQTDTSVTGRSRVYVGFCSIHLTATAGSFYS